MNLIEQKPVPRRLLHFSYDQKNYPMLGPRRYSAILCHVVSRPNRVPSLLVYLCRRAGLCLRHIAGDSEFSRYRPLTLLIAMLQVLHEEVVGLFGQFHDSGEL